MFSIDSHLNPPDQIEVKEVVIDCDSIKEYASRLSNYNLVDLLINEICDCKEFAAALREFTDTIDCVGSLENNQAGRDMNSAIHSALQSITQRAANQ